jgi:hypothetical protein
VPSFLLSGDGCRTRLRRDLFQRTFPRINYKVSLLLNLDLRTGIHFQHFANTRQIFWLIVLLCFAEAEYKPANYGRHRLHLLEWHFAIVSVTVWFVLIISQRNLYAKVGNFCQIERFPYWWEFPILQSLKKQKYHIREKQSYKWLNCILPEP